MVYGRNVSLNNFHGKEGNSKGFYYIENRFRYFWTNILQVSIHLIDNTHDNTKIYQDNIYHFILILNW